MKLKGGSFTGSFKGTLGNYTVYTRKGEQILRMKQENVFNPQSELQLQQRGIFKNATTLLKTIRDDVKQMYGAIDKNTEYSALMKLMLNSVDVQAPHLALGLPSGIENPYKMIKQDKIGLSLNTLASNYTGEELNIFDMGVTMAMYNTTGESTTAELYPYLFLIDNVMKEIPETQNPLYFGTDVLLPFNATFRAINHTVENGIVKTVDTFRAALTFSPYLDETVEQNSVAKNRGFFTNVKNCGGGWNFIYQIPGQTLGFLRSNANFTKSNFQWMEDNVYYKESVVSSTFIIAVPVRSAGPAAQILKAHTSSIRANSLTTYNYQPPAVE